MSTTYTPYYKGEPVSLPPLKMFLDFFYPVGSYYETTDTDFDPNTSWTGEWELESGGLVHISAGNYYTSQSSSILYAVQEQHTSALNVDADGGEPTHLLTAAESGVPKHGHSASSGAGYTNAMRIVASYGTTYAANHATGYNGGSYKDITNSSNFPGASHTHSITVNQNTAANASSAHNNMQPYKIVNRWHRTA
jgi:hypothetical protein